MFLNNGEEKESPKDKEEDEHQNFAQFENIGPCSETDNSELFSHLNYMSMMLGASSNTGQSMEINAMAMKYLKDDQLTQMAMMLKQGNGSEDPHTNNKLLRRMLSDSRETQSKPEISQFGLSPNNMTIGTREYLEKHGLLGNDSQYVDDFTMLNHTLKLNTDFSMAVTEDGSFKNSTNLFSPNFAAIKRQGVVRQLPSNDGQLNFNGDDQSKTKNGSGSPVFLAHRLPTQRRNIRGRHGRGIDSDDDEEDAGSTENILDIAKLKQLPKLL